MVVLLDACFVINLLVEDSQFHNNALEFFKRLSNDNNVIMKISTIAVSEYAIKGDTSLIPSNIQRLAFNYTHAVRAGKFGSVSAKCRATDTDKSNRDIVLNDSKMFAQADVERIDCFITADHKAYKVYNWLKEAGLVSFRFVDITTTSYTAFFGEIDFPVNLE